MQLIFQSRVLHIKETPYSMNKLHNHLIELAHRYHQPSFIGDDPIQFPCSYSRLQDIEVSGLLTAYISFGRRKMIIDAASRLHNIMQHQPYEYVMSCRWKEDFKEGDKTFYRTLANKDIAAMFYFLHQVYSLHSTMQEWMIAENKGLPIETLLWGLGLSKTSAQKKLNMFMRWMIRKDSPVDIGCWTDLHPRDLVIPLDTHVHQMALELGITQSKTASFKTALEITNYFKLIFPDDPCLGDFALFGFGVNRKK